MNRRVRLLVTFLALGAVSLAACVPPVSGPRVDMLYVAPYAADCVGVGPQQCLLVREEQDSEWTLFYDRIEGFEYEEGYQYVLRVQQEKVDNPPADASSIRWVLVEEVEKTRSLEGTRWLLDAYQNSDGVLVDARPGSEASVRLAAGEAGGNASCNTYFGAYEVDGEKLSVEVGGMTEMWCAPEELMAQETDYVAALNRAASYVIVGDTLQMADATGTPILTYNMPEPAGVQDTLWQVTRYNDGKGGITSVLLGSEITTSFGSDGVAGGSAGCNRFSGPYEIDGSSITVGPLASTMMMCGAPEGIMDQEQAFLAALQSAASISIEGNELTLLNPGGTVAVEYAVRESTPLVGTPWLMSGYSNGKEAVVSAMAGTEVTALFAEDGTLTGSAGCNRYTTSYEIEGDSIAIGPTATTRMMCPEPEGIMEQEAAYLAALESAVAYSIEADRLVMTNADGGRVVDFRAVETGSGQGPTMEQLQNAQYRSEWVESGVVQLTDGEYREPAAPGSAMETVVMLTEFVAFGQLADGRQAAAVVLVTDPGGSGTFYNLALVVMQGGSPVNTASTPLGDRVQIQDIAFQDGEIAVRMIAHGPDDPMCCPTKEVVQTYGLEGDELVERPE